MSKKIHPVDFIKEKRKTTRNSWEIRHINFFVSSTFSGKRAIYTWVTRFLFKKILVLLQDIFGGLTCFSIINSRSSFFLDYIAPNWILNFSLTLLHLSWRKPSVVPLVIIWGHHKAWPCLNTSSDRFSFPGLQNHCS